MLLRATTLECNNKESKELIPEMKQRRLRAIALQRAKEKNPIVLLQYCKKCMMDSTIIISHFGGTNNTLADYIQTLRV